MPTFPEQTNRFAQIHAAAQLARKRIARRDFAPVQATIRDVRAGKQIPFVNDPGWQYRQTVPVEVAPTSRRRTERAVREIEDDDTGEVIQVIEMSEVLTVTNGIDPEILQIFAEEARRKV